MAMVVLGVLLLTMWLGDIGPVGAWPWYAVFWPFGLAVVWWAWADATGWTKQREIIKMDKKREKRRIENLDALGMDHKGRRGKSTTAKHARNHHR